MGHPRGSAASLGAFRYLETSMFPRAGSRRPSVPVEGPRRLAGGSRTRLMNPNNDYRDITGIPSATNRLLRAGRRTRDLDVTPLCASDRKGKASRGNVPKRVLALDQVTRKRRHDKALQADDRRGGVFKVYTGAGRVRDGAPASRDTKRQPIHRRWMLQTRCRRKSVLLSVCGLSRVAPTTSVERRRPCPSPPGKLFPLEQSVNNITGGSGATRFLCRPAHAVSGANIPLKARRQRVVSLVTGGLRLEGPKTLLSAL
ncbi:hypothetical protein EVAR_62027_1 [Eumeta japonica]|uniref:Uncharacterized protein n=1 Tax=Eumeta variegata TaxID=151549 RepID=A0A4C1ZFH0_EUMVA|nr:hypothetical protein EVAR_62027_1 [Eumeta japonica]